MLNLTKRDVNLIKRRRADGYKVRTIAEELGVSSTVVWKVSRGEGPTEEEMKEAQRLRTERKRERHENQMTKAAREDLRAGALPHVVANVYGLPKEKVVRLAAGLGRSGRVKLS